MTQLQSNAAGSASSSTSTPSRSTRSPPSPRATAWSRTSPATGTWATGAAAGRSSPDYYPSGETLFLCGSGANSGGYTNAENDSLINATLTSSSLQALYNWQDYLASRSRSIWQPNGVYQLTEIANNLRGVIPQSSTLTINPENWFFVKS